MAWGTKLSVLDFRWRKRVFVSLSHDLSALCILWSFPVPPSSWFMAASLSEVKKKETMLWMSSTWNLATLVVLPVIQKSSGHMLIERNKISSLFLFFCCSCSKTLPAWISYVNKNLIWSPEHIIDTAGYDSVQMQNVPVTCLNATLLLPQQSVLKSGPWKCECNAAQQPGKVRTSK